MPKTKTSSAAKKRFKLSAAGKLLRRHAMASHNLEKKSAKRKRSFGKQHAVSPSNARAVKRLLGRR